LQRIDAAEAAAFEEFHRPLTLDETADEWRLRFRRALVAYLATIEPEIEIEPGKPESITLDRLAEQIRQWQRATFPKATPSSVASHLLREAGELRMHPGDPSEIADLFHLVVGAAQASGHDLAVIVTDKFRENQAREWGDPDDEGVVEHKRAPVWQVGDPDRRDPARAHWVLNLRDRRRCDDEPLGRAPVTFDYTGPGGLPMRGKVESRGAELAVWSCAIGMIDRKRLPQGSDSPLRRAVGKIFKRLAGEAPSYFASGWGGRLETLEGPEPNLDQSAEVCPLFDNPGCHQAREERAREHAETRNPYGPGGIYPQMPEPAPEAFNDPRWSRTARGDASLEHEPGVPKSPEELTDYWLEELGKARRLLSSDVRSFLDAVAEVRAHQRRAAEVIADADLRCLAADGPVGHVRNELTDDEWRELYALMGGKGFGDAPR